MVWKHPNTKYLIVIAVVSSMFFNETFLLAKYIGNKTLSQSPIQKKIFKCIYIPFKSNAYIPFKSNHSIGQYS